MKWWMPTMTTTESMAPPELGLLLPLSGVQLIEASAGTGKTHTLATLYLRLVLEARLPVDRLLAVTYTIAAAAELRDRLRQQLRRALDRLDAATTEIDAIAQLLQIALRTENEAALRQRLRRAVAAMDAAPIYTIHAFCQRALADYALEAGQAAIPREVVANEAELRLEVATEFWRAQSRTVAGTRQLAAWPGPRALATTLQDLLAVDGLEPLAPMIDDSAERALGRAQAELAEAFRLDGDAARQQLRRAAVSGAVNRARSKDKAVDAVWASLALWQADPAQDGVLHKNLFWYGNAALRDKWNAKHGPVPASPLFAAIDAWREASAAAERARFQSQLALLHELRAFGSRRLSQLKRARNRIGFDDLVTELAEALSGEQGEALVARLQRQYRVALVDEFQDTDARQSAIFARLFGRAATHEEDGAARALFLIGDPKQAIYRFRGGDVTAYLLAAQRAEKRHSLTHNFRSRPLALSALEALYGRAGELAFGRSDIAFHPVQPGSTTHDQDFQRHDAIAPALTLLQLDAITPELAIDAAREAAAAAAARAILDLLEDGAAGRARCRRRDETTLSPVRPGDIAVLVETHQDAQTMRAALAALAIPAVIAGRDSVFASDEAEDLRRLLQALRAPADEGRLRAVLATVLLGFDATEIAALDVAETSLPSWQETMQGWRERVLRHGPLALLNTLCAEQAARLLRLPMGERRLANYLQLGEALQELAGGAPSIDALLDAFERRIADADRENEDEQLRLESDADRVTIQTLHASKGLEFEFVFLPLIATRGAGRRPSPPEFARYHDGERRVLHLLGEDEAHDRELRAMDEEEARAERLRLLYVGLTRARLATWIVWPRAKQVEDTPLAWLLHREAAGTTVVTPDPVRFGADLEALRAAAAAAIAVQSATPWPAARYRPATPESPPPARRARRELSRDWWVYSYSALAREARGDDDTTDERGADDEVATIPIGERSRFAGTRFGHALHTALERCDFARWRDLDPDALPSAETEGLNAALREQGYSGEAELTEGRALLARLIHATLNVRLPEGGRLCELGAEARRDELEFHLHLAPTAITDLIAVLHAHGVVSERQGFGARRRIEGLLTGRIDLVYAQAGRYYVLDYKSNRLADYRPAALAEAVRDSEYDLQYVLYTLALHRWLRFRLGAAYDYERDFGGVRYLFCRGLDPTSNDGNGIHALVPPRALIEALDALFDLTDAAA